MTFSVEKLKSSTAFNIHNVKRPFSFVTDGKSDDLNVSPVEGQRGGLKFVGLIQVPMDP